MAEKKQLAPTTLGLQSSFGFGDRLGLATAGHIAAMRSAGKGIAPIYPQQSIREMNRMNRSAEAVMADAVNAVAEAGWDEPFGADADHLKTTADVDRVFEAGFTFYTIDPSDAVDAKVDGYPADMVRERFAEVRDEATWLEKYRGKQVRLATGSTIDFEDETLERVAVKYARAINHSLQIADHIRRRGESAGRECEIELSVDETDQPTTLAEHYLVADQCIAGGMKLVSLAPRFVGHMEKGVDFIGDLDEFERSLRDHQAIASQLGPYKLSLHSGSDKLTVYPILARVTEGRFHVKTSGTSYLEALRVVAQHDPQLFRNLCEFARVRYDIDKASYHVHATLQTVAPPAACNDAQLEQIYLGKWSEVPAGSGFTAAGRQILHCTFGSVLSDAMLGPAIRECVAANQTTYTALLADHFERHLRALQSA